MQQEVLLGGRAHLLKEHRKARSSPKHRNSRTMWEYSLSVDWLIEKLEWNNNNNRQSSQTGTRVIGLESQAKIFELDSQLRSHWSLFKGWLVCISGRYTQPLPYEGRCPLPYLCTHIKLRVGSPWFKHLSLTVLERIIVWSHPTRNYLKIHTSTLWSDPHTVFKAMNVNKYVTSKLQVVFRHPSKCSGLSD